MSGIEFDLLITLAAIFALVLFGLFLIAVLRRASPRPQGLDTVERKPLTVAERRAFVIDRLPEADVVSVLDGDTLFVANGSGQTKIRLACVDCPEDGQPWGDIATYGLMKMVNRRRLRLEEHGLDVYGRTLATLYVRDTKTGEWLNVNERMVMLGHAWVMRSFYGHLPNDRQDKLNRLEAWAQSKKVGLWRTENPVAPWLWRQQAKVVTAPAVNPANANGDSSS